MSFHLVHQAALGDRDRSAMIDLYARHFDRVDPTRFRNDLAEKNWVVLVEDGSGRLAAFSTILLYDAEIEGEEVRVAFSGDTIVDPTHWAEGELARAWIRSIRHLHAAHPGRRLFWFLISGGFRTYRFLPVFFREFWPRYDRTTPPEVRATMDRLAVDRFHQSYDQPAGVVRFPAPGILSEPLRGIPPGRLANPHVAFFAKANPGHEASDELVCLAEIAEANLTPGAIRVWRSAREAELLVCQ